MCACVCAGNPCHARGCLNGGRCSVSADYQNRICTCPSNYMGDYCQYPTTDSNYIATPPPIGQRSIAMSASVCLSVCLSACVFVCPRSYLRNFTSDLRKIFVLVLPMAVARSSSSGVVICYVLLLLWMTSCLLISQDCSTSPPS